MSEKEKIVSVLLSGEFISILGNMYIKFNFIIFLISFQLQSALVLALSERECVTYQSLGEIAKLNNFFITEIIFCASKMKKSSFLLIHAVSYCSWREICNQQKNKIK